MARQPSQTSGLWVQVKVPHSMYTWRVSKNYTWVQFLAFKCIHVVPLGDLGTWEHTHTGYINSTLPQNSVVVSTITMFIIFKTEWGGPEEIKFFFLFQDRVSGRATVLCTFSRPSQPMDPLISLLAMCGNAFVIPVCGLISCSWMQSTDWLTMTTFREHFIFP